MKLCICDSMSMNQKSISFVNQTNYLHTKSTKVNYATNVLEPLQIDIANQKEIISVKFVHDVLSAS